MATARTEEKKREVMNIVPWKTALLSEWSIVGMNHYYIGGERRLFVAMTKDGQCITEEGRDDEYLWNRLWHKAAAIATEEEKETE